MATLLWRLELKSHVAGRLRDNELYLGHMTANLLRFAVPLGWFGRIKTEKGEHAGKVDLKKAGIFAITEGVKILSLRMVCRRPARSRGSSGWQRGECSRKRRLMTSPPVFTHWCISACGPRSTLSSDGQPDNRITLAELNRMEQERLRAALEGVREFQQTWGGATGFGQTM